MRNSLFRLAAAVSFAGMFVSGCASTNVTRATQSAPITYKMGQGDAQYASLDYSNRPSQSAIQRSHDPIGGQGRTFNPHNVDRNLYSHQKVGERYTIMGQTYTPKHDPDYNETGEASWYGPKFHGKPTATGESFNKNAMTAAHKTLPLNSLVRVTNLANGRSVTVRLNDRGPFIGDRMIDMSEAAASALGFRARGVADVRVRYLGPANPVAGTQTLPRSEPRLVALPLDNLAPRPAAPLHTAPRPTAPRPVAPYPTTPSPLAPQYTAPDVTAPRMAQLPLEEYSAPPAAPLPTLPSAPPYQAPYQAPVVPTPTPRYTGPSLPAPIAPSSPRRAPEDDLPSGGDITMTIKGPIHIARSTDDQQLPKYYKGRHKTK